jgi:purine-binding chemotaxis protein CheW
MDQEQKVDASETEADLENDGFNPEVFTGENEFNVEELILKDIDPVKNGPEKPSLSLVQNEENLYATFILEGDEFAVDVNYVREAILLKEDIVRIPNTIDIVEGILNLRGEIIPVVNLKKRFEMESVEYGSECRVAIVRYRKFNFGLLFDDISEVIRVEKKEVNEIEAGKPGTNSSIEGVINLENDKRIIQIFNTDLLFEEYDLPLIKEIAGANDSDIHNISRIKVLDTMQCITILIDGQEYGIKVNNIREIIKPVEVKRKVKIEEYVKGVFFQRKELLSLVDMRLYMKLEEKEVDPESRFIIINDENPYGILVDAIKEVITFEKKDILKIPLLSENCLKDCFGGVVDYSNVGSQRHIILIDVELLFDEYGKMRIEENLSLHKKEQTYEEKRKNRSDKQDVSSGEVLENRVYISFLLGEVLAIDILMLQEIIPYTEKILKLPNQFDSFEGVLNLRGNIIPVINLRKFFEMDPYPDINDAKIVILNHNDNCTGFIVDDVQEIITTDSKSCKGVHKLLTMGSERQFKGLVSEVLNVSLRGGETRTVMVLDIDGFIKGIDLKKNMDEIGEIEEVKPGKEPKTKKKSGFFQKLKSKTKI